MYFPIFTEFKTEHPPQPEYDCQYKVFIFSIIICSTVVKITNCVPVPVTVCYSVITFVYVCSVKVLLTVSIFTFQEESKDGTVVCHNFVCK